MRTESEAEVKLSLFLVLCQHVFFVIPQPSESWLILHVRYHWTNTCNKHKLLCRHWTAKSRFLTMLVKTLVQSTKSSLAGTAKVTSLLLYLFQFIKHFNDSSFWIGNGNESMVMDITYYSFRTSALPCNRSELEQRCPSYSDRPGFDPQLRPL